MSATISPHKVRIQYGEIAFDAEGNEDTVQGQYDRFMAFLESAPANLTKPPTKQNNHPSSENETDDHEDQEVLSSRQKGLFLRAYRTDAEDVSLRVLPPGNGDAARDAEAIVLLLYGFLRLKNQQDVSAGDLMSAARQSGIQRERLDRVMPTEFINRGGRRKGVRYSLNNRGIARAEELLEQMFE